MFLFLVAVSGCHKDKLTEQITGTYYVSGLRISVFEPHDSLAINNAVIVISKQNTEWVNAVFRLPDSSEFALKYDKNASEADNFYTFSWGTGDSDSFHNAQLSFLKSDKDSMIGHYYYQKQTITGYDYQLTGRKR